jgi:rubrerythrin
MDNKAGQKKLIEALINNEKALEDLYKTYADKLLLYSDFWHKIAEDEKSHAAWIGTLYAKMEKGLVDFSEKRFPVDAVNDFIKYIQEKKKEALDGNVTLLQALETAVHMERGLLESKFFEVFKDDSLEIKIILEALRMGTEEHLREVERVWKKEKGGSNYEKQTS